MRKKALVLCAVFLALPVLCLAGSATSRWDLTIGGYVKFDMGWGSQSQGQDAWSALRQGKGAFDNAADQNGNFYAYSGETTLNFLARGPDAWGAKTFGFVEGYFRGQEGSANATGQGYFVLRHAFMQLEWPTTKLLIGQTWNKWGFLPSYGGFLLDFTGLAPFLKGQRQPLIRVEQTFAKNWNWSLGAIAPTSTLGGAAGATPTGTVDGYSLSQMPFFEGSLGWMSDKCGNIGPWKLLFNLEGFYGRQKMVYNAISSPNALVISNKEVDAWGVAFKGFIPIVPEKKGNKKGALSASGVVFYTQNPSWFQGPDTTTTYNYGSLGWAAFHAPIVYGGWGQVSYWLTDQVSVNGWYGYSRNVLSNNYMATVATPNQIQNTTQYIMNIMYDVNAAVRFGLEGAYFNTRYANYGFTSAGTPGNAFNAQKDGSYYTVRVGAYYFF